MQDSEGGAEVRIVPVHPGLGSKFALPQRMSAQAAGFDVCAALDAPRALEPGARTLVPCGFILELPVGFEAQVRSRSGLALRQGLFCLNAPGTIDADFRGEVHVLLANFGAQTCIIEPGERVAQLVFCRLPSVRLQVVEQVHSTTERGSGGFGSTGTQGAAHG